MAIANLQSSSRHYDVVTLGKADGCMAWICWLTGWWWVCRDLHPLLFAESRSALPPIWVLKRCFIFGRTAGANFVTDFLVLPFLVNVSFIPSKASCFHFTTMLGWIPNLRESSAIVPSPLIAARATLAFYSLEYCFLFAMSIRLLCLSTTP